MQKREKFNLLTLCIQFMQFRHTEHYKRLRTAPLVYISAHIIGLCGGLICCSLYLKSKLLCGLRC